MPTVLHQFHWDYPEKFVYCFDNIEAFECVTDALVLGDLQAKACVYSCLLKLNQRQ